MLHVTTCSLNCCTCAEIIPQIKEQEVIVNIINQTNKYKVQQKLQHVMYIIFTIENSVFPSFPSLHGGGGCSPLAWSVFRSDIIGLFWGQNKNNYYEDIVSIHVNGRTIIILLCCRIPWLCPLPCFYMLAKIWAKVGNWWDCDINFIRDDYYRPMNATWVCKRKYMIVWKHHMPKTNCQVII